MSLKSLISPLAVAAVLAIGSALPASAAILDRGNFIVQFERSPSVDQSSLSPAQRTQLEDQCRQRQADSNDDIDSDDDESSAPFRASAAFCASIGLPA